MVVVHVNPYYHERTWRLAADIHLFRVEDHTRLSSDLQAWGDDLRRIQEVLQMHQVLVWGGYSIWIVCHYKSALLHPPETRQTSALVVQADW